MDAFATYLYHPLHFWNIQSTSSQVCCKQYTWNKAHEPGDEGANKPGGQGKQTSKMEQSVLGDTKAMLHLLVAS
jgi:hypothetical protein